MLELHRHLDPRAFLERAERWPLTREVEHGVVLQSARQAAWVERRGGSWSVNTRGRLMSFSGGAGGAGGDEAGKKGVLRLAGANDTALAQSWGAAASIDSGITALDGSLCIDLLRTKFALLLGRRSAAPLDRPAARDARLGRNRCSAAASSTTL